MTLLPADIPTGTVVGNWYFVDEDASTMTEDVVPVSGSVIFKASVPVIRIPGKPATVIPLVFEAVFDSNGNLAPKNGSGTGIALPATDSPLTNPTGFTWNVSFDLRDPVSHYSINIPAFDIQVPTGATVDLTNLVPVSTSPGTITLQGPKGDTGPANTLAIGTVTTGAAGSSASATITGTAPNQTLSLTIPQGNVGATGPANTLGIGTVTTGAAGSNAAASITGAAPNQTLNLTIPTGAQGPQGPAAYATTEDIRSKGAVAGTTDSSSAFIAAMTDAKNSSATLPFSLASDPRSSVVIEIPPGVWTIDQVNGMIGSEGMTTKAVGLKIKGAGKGLTNVVFNPASAGALNFNNYWLDIEFTGIDFYATIAGCTFMQSYTTANAQHYLFNNCSFYNFKYILDLQGSNNNSEFVFNECDAYAIGTKEADITSGAWLYIGASNTSDQFLNYWWYGCRFWSSSSPIINASKGGSFHIFGMDVSDWGDSLTATGYLFQLLGTSHSYGVQNFEANGLRCEFKNINAALIHSQWPSGQVTFRNLDMSSQVSTYTYGNVIFVEYVNMDGAIYSFEDSVLAGGVKVNYNTNDWQHQHALTFTNCLWLQKTSPSDVVTYGMPGSNYQVTPPVRFVKCRGTQNDVTVAAGGVTWDAVIGYNGETLQSFHKRELSVRHIYGIPSGSSVVYARVPVGALITSINVLSPAGAVTASNTNGSWTVATTETTPTTIGTVSVTTAQNAGFNVENVLAVPYYCSNAQQATISITPNNISQYNTKGLLLIKGYW